MTIKKALGVLLSLAFILGLSACGGGGGATDTGSSTSSSSSLSSGSSSSNNSSSSSSAGAYSVAGAVSGNTGTVTLLNNGGNAQSVTGNGGFTFTAQNYGSSYSVTVGTQPTGQNCVVTNGVGTVTGAVTNVTVSCTTNAYTVGGTVTGNTGTVLLLNNAGKAQSVSVTGNGSFAFAAQNYGSSYSVTVGYHSAGQNCVVTNGLGTVTAQVSNVTVSCTTDTYAVSGSVTGNTGTVTLLNNGGNAQSVTGSGGFTFTAQNYGTTYSVTVGTQPTGQTCSVSNGAGTVTAQVSNVTVSCSTNTYTVGGSVTSNTGTVTLLNNAGNAQSVTGNGSFAFTAQNYGTTYAVTVGTQPTGQTCLVSNGAGAVAGAVTNVTVSCSTNTYTVGGSVTGSTGTVSLLNNFGDPQTVTGNGNFTFTAQNYGTAYAVTVGTQPTGQTCLVSNATGIVTAQVNNVTVTCPPSAVPVVAVSYHRNPDQVILNWAPVSGATYYTISKDPTGSSGYSPICQTNSPTATTCIDAFSKLTDFITASYKVAACKAAGCISSAPIAGFTTQAIQYIKASNTDAGDRFGWSVALSGDGSTLAVGAQWEASAATGINGNQVDNSAYGAGAVYVFTRNGTTWSQQAYIKASNTNARDGFCYSVALSADGNTLAVGAVGESSGAGAVYVYTRNGATWSQQAYVKASNTNSGDGFGSSVALSADGSTLAVGASQEASAATGINSNQADNSDPSAGAVYVFTRNGATWSQQAYIKASNTNLGDSFGSSVALSADGSTLAVGADVESSSATGINGIQADNSAPFAGAVYVFTRNGATWSQQAYVKASNSGSGILFGSSVALSADGSTLAVGAQRESSGAIGINSSKPNISAQDAGAAYVFTRNGTTWSQQAYIKASNTNSYDRFGVSVALSADGNTLAVGAVGESSAATSINGNQADNSAQYAGAVYLYTRSGSTWVTWNQQSYIKASNTDAGDHFSFVALSADGSTLAVGASESSAATGINGDQIDNSAQNAGAVYLYQ